MVGLMVAGSLWKHIWSKILFCFVHTDSTRIGFSWYIFGKIFPSNSNGLCSKSFEKDTVESNLSPIPWMSFWFSCADVPFWYSYLIWTFDQQRLISWRRNSKFWQVSYKELFLYEDVYGNLQISSPPRALVIMLPIVKRKIKQSRAEWSFTHTFEFLTFFYPSHALTN